MSTSPRILITRPQGQHQRLIRACRELGLEVDHMPCLTIEPLITRQNQRRLQQARNRVLFTSTNAVHFAHQHHPLPWSAIKAHAIGGATADCLRRYGQSMASEPLAPFDSQAFLSAVRHLPAQPLMIIKGCGGRTVVSETLQQAGWQITSVEVYQRRCPTDQEVDVSSCLSGAGFDLISAGSNETLENLVRLGRNFLPSLLGAQLLVNSARAAYLAEELDFELPPMIASPAGDEGQIDCIRRWINGQKG